jgi:hypothetical protein
VDSSVIGGCEDEEFTALTLQELAAAPTEVRRHLASVPEAHIVNLQRIHGYNSVNLREGYPTLEIRAPREVLPDE